MSDLWTIALEVLAELGRSDVDGHPPHPVYSYLAVMAAHLGMGMGLALGLVWWPLSRARVIRSWLPLALIGLWTLKELASDLRQDGFALRTWADSAADLTFGALGFWFARRALQRAGGQPFHNAGNQPLNPAVAPDKSRGNHART
jgi:hypothetical protein